MNKISNNILNHIRTELQDILKIKDVNDYIEQIKVKAEQIEYGKIVATVLNEDGEKIGELIIELRNKRNKIDVVTEKCESGKKVIITTEQRKRFEKTDQIRLDTT